MLIHKAVEFKLESSTVYSDHIYKLIFHYKFVLYASLLFIPTIVFLPYLFQDLSGRPHLSYNLDIPTQRVGTYDTQVLHVYLHNIIYTSSLSLRFCPNSFWPFGFRCFQPRYCFYVNHFSLFLLLFCLFFYLLMNPLDILVCSWWSIFSSL